MKYDNIFKIQPLPWWEFIQNTYLILNLHIHFQSAQNQHELATAAQCWNTATTEKRNIWLDPGINLSYERQLKGKSIRLWHHCFRDGHTARSQGWRRVRSSLRQSFENGVDLLGNSCQGKFKLVLETRIKSFRCLKLCSNQQQANIYIKSGSQIKALHMAQVWCGVKPHSWGNGIQSSKIQFPKKFA